MEYVKIYNDSKNEEVDKIIQKYPFKRKIDFKEETKEDMKIYLFGLSEENTIDDGVFYISLANLIQEIIIEVFAIDILYKRINKMCSDYSQADKKDISIYAYNNLLNIMFFNREKDILNRELLEYLIEYSTININGYTRFRPETINLLLDKSIEKAIDDIEVEKQYLEFLYMLQYFVDIQEPKVKEVNILTDQGNYIIMDENNNIIRNKSIEDLANDPSYDDITSSDLLVSSLIILAPENIILHIEDGEEELIDILEKIFLDRIKICNGCKTCKSGIKVKTEK